jgi:hypothetical protein
MAQDRLLTGVLELEPNNVDPGEARAIAERLRVYLSREDLFDVLERSRMESILSEQGFQISGACDSEECIIQVGALLGAQKMVAGSVSSVGTLYTLQVRIIDIGTGRIEETAFYDVNGIEQVLQTATLNCVKDLARGVRERMGMRVEEDPQAAERPVTEEEIEQPQTQQRLPGETSTDRFGWIFRLNSGPALSGFKSDASNGLTVTGGSATATGLSFGRAIGQNLVVSFIYWKTTISGPTLKTGVLEVEMADDFEVSAGGVGFGITKYYMPRNSHLGIALLLPKMSVNDAATGISAETETGSALQFTAGKEWWLIRGLSVGVAGQLVFGSMKEEGQDASTFRMSTLGLQLSLTWQLKPAP